jgi:hypothetical protein
MLLRSVQPLVSLVHLPVSLAGPRPSDSAGPSRRCRGCLPPMPVRLDGVGCPQLARACCDRPAAMVSHHRTAPERIAALRVPNPDPIAFPGNLRHSRQNRPRTKRLARQHDPVFERDPQQRGGGRRTRCPYRSRGARACDASDRPTPTARTDRGSPAPPRPAAGAPHHRPTDGHPATRSPAAALASGAHARRRGRAPGTLGCAPTRRRPRRRSAPAARAWSARSRAIRPGRKARAPPSPVQRQLDRELLERLREAIVLRAQQLQLDSLHRRRPPRLR